MASQQAPAATHEGEAHEVLAEQAMASAGQSQAMYNYSQKVIEQKERELMESLAKNYGRIREVERELGNLQLQFKLTSGPKKAALEVMRKKIEVQTEKVAAVRAKHTTAKAVYEKLDAELQQEEAVKDTLCEELNMLVQQAARAQYDKLEELKTHLEALYSGVAPGQAAAFAHVAAVAAAASHINPFLPPPPEQQPNPFLPPPPALPAPGAGAAGPSAPAAAQLAQSAQAPPQANGAADAEAAAEAARQQQEAEAKEAERQRQQEAERQQREAEAAAARSRHVSLRTGGTPGPKPQAAAQPRAAPARAAAAAAAVAPAPAAAPKAAAANGKSGSRFAGFDT